MAFDFKESFTIELPEMKKEDFNFSESNNPFNGGINSAGLAGSINSVDFINLP